MNTLAIYMGREKMPGACEVYRVNMPFVFLGKKSKYRFDWDYFINLFETSLRVGTKLWERILGTYDLLVFPRAFNPSGDKGEFLLRLISLFKGAGKKVIYEVDDDYTNEFRHVCDGDMVGVASLCHAITVTTPFLAERMTRLTNGVPSYVLPNMIDPKIWHRTPEQFAVPRDHPDQVIIGLTGSATHEHDWEVLADPLTRLTYASDDIKLVVGGYIPAYLEGLPNATYIPPVQYTIYAEIVRSCDVILAPVKPDDGFNDSKSEIKTTEGQSAMRYLGTRKAGAAVIATDNHVYREGIKHGETGLLVEHTPEGWYEALTQLINDTDLRQNLQVNGFKWANRHRNIKTGWPRWKQAYAEIAKG
jgi:glycosyltransferase involved in cell wall biosynthesis